ncbi:hypothetical protein MKW94_020454 [Papaver nudicaule]|uniref:Uncharacterized protein n=1 Tax=Papaver nudicaule TaxID=74823 RepID=A0AA41VNE4_PAPNU|nr:hypothetical protein [Papaver nudicaule]
MNQIRSRRMLRSSTSSIPSTPVSMMKPPTPKRLMTQEKPELRQQYQSITTDLQSLMKMVKDEFGNQELDMTQLGNSFSVTPFERGRFYDEYSARRNERLRRRKGETVEEKKKPSSAYNLGVVESSIKKRGGEQKKLESLRKSVPANFSIPRSEMTTTTSRYSLRSSTKDVSKLTMSSGKLSFSGVDGERSKINTRRGSGVRKI